jgi:hypothetical protein
LTVYSCATKPGVTTNKIAAARPRNVGKENTFKQFLLTGILLRVR